MGLLLLGEGLGDRLMRGLLLLGCGKSTIRFSPPLCITKAEVEEGLLMFEDALSAAELAI